MMPICLNCLKKYEGKKSKMYCSDTCRREDKTPRRNLVGRIEDISDYIDCDDEYIY